ncbi:hypothetical protein I600_1992 [Maribacter dokdonensis DSW-8]|nr:hypothetical protein I600_1992 [Maribacter dokdonensis DSW-8]
MLSSSTVHGAVAATVYVCVLSPLSVHVPPVSGEPVNCANKFALVNVSPWQIFNVPSIPAFGCACSTTVTILSSSTAHGAVAATVYVCVLSPLSVHVPPVSGEPVNCANKSALVNVSPSQIFNVPSIPAFGCACSVTVTILSSSTVQGDVADTVYVCVPLPLSTQVPPVSGLPVSCANKSLLSKVSPTQIFSVPSIPAFGCACSVTVTILSSSTVHGTVATTVYVCVPLPLSVHVPPVSGEPVNCANKSALVNVAPSQIFNVPPPPAFGCACSTMVTILSSSTVQGDVADTVYVWVPSPLSTQVPPVSGLPVSCANKSLLSKVSPTQIFSVPSIPAYGCACSTTVTILSSSIVQGDVAATVYVCVPSLLSTQVPPVSGFPVNCAKRSALVNVSPSQMFNVPSIPAFGCACSTTVTILSSSTAHGAVAATVYV